MTQSFVAWVDYSQVEQDNMRKALALFKNTETRDELGLGMIRDVLADLLFPGTSTIQTRLRYFLFVPWLYRDLARRKAVTAANVHAHLRTNELALIDPLMAQEDTEGVFGSLSGHTIKRLPSSVYWNGLRTWKIFKVDRWSQEEFHLQWDHIRERNAQVVLTDDAGIAPDLLRVWDSQLPPPPSAWPTVMDMRLTRTEAEYLKGRIESSCGGTLLAYFVSNRPDLETGAPWDAVDRLPAKLERLLNQSQAFSIAMRGAALLYSLELCKASTQPNHRELIEQHEAAMQEWAASAQPLLGTWEPQQLWSFLAECGYAVPEGRHDRAFVTAWFGLARKHTPLALAGNAKARRLLEDREFRLKGPRSRFRNEQARNRWGGASGTALMDYRWFRVRKLLRDLYEGLDRPAGEGE